MKTHTLANAVTVDGKIYTAITLREPDVDAREAIDDLGIEPGKPVRVRQMRGVIAALADCPDAVIGKIGKADFRALSEMVVPLLADETESGPPSTI